MAAKVPAVSSSATVGLCASEQWIRERLNLHQDSLDDVRSLSLPGSYSEKITHFGRSLLNFTRLKHLDISRNAIESLEGLEHLKFLETLNLYYNNVSSLKELFRLRHNSRLKELDLRLNPITKNEPDYRLFVVHMLVNLRKLDDYGVRDSERKAALMHFDSDQGYEFDRSLSPHSGQDRRGGENDDNSRPHKHIASRTALVKSLHPRSTGFGDDTDQLLDLIANSDRFLSSPNTRSHHHTPHHTPHPNMEQLDESTPRRYPHYTKEGHSSPRRLRLKPEARKSHKVRSPPVNRNLESSNEGSRDLHHPRQTHAYTYTPAPSITRDNDDTDSLPLKALHQLLSLFQEHVEGDLMVLQRDPIFQDKLRSWYEEQSEFGAVRGNVGQLESLRGEVEALQKELINMESQLCEKDKSHWTKESRVKELEEMLNQEKAKCFEMGRQLQAQVTQTEELSKKMTVLEEYRKTMKQTRMDMSSQQQQMHTVQEENRSLKSALDAAPSASLIEKQHRKIRELEAENQTVKEEMERLLDRHKQDLVNTAQVQEMATMLQESHRSLVATNDHLLQELEEARERHSREVLQMNINYEQLRKTVQLYT